MAKRTIIVQDRCTTPECNRVLYRIAEGERGQCSTCWFKQLPADKRQAMNRLITSAFNGSTPTEKEAAVKEAFDKFKADVREAFGKFKADQNEFKLGDRVRCHDPGSWIHERTGTVESLNVVSSDGIKGHRVRVEGVGWTVVPPEQLSKDDG